MAKHRISATHHKGTHVFVVDGSLSDEIAERGGLPARIDVVHNPSPTWPGTVSATYSVTNITSGPISRLEGCYLISGTDAEYGRDDTLVLQGYQDQEAHDRLADGTPPSPKAADVPGDIDAV